MGINKYDRYLIEDLRRINSRFYLIQIHGKSYIWDFYDLGDFRNYYPFEVFYPKKKSWNLYDVTGEEYKYKTNPQIGRRVPKPFTFWMESAIFFVAISMSINLLLPLLIIVGMILFTIWKIKKINQIDINLKPCYILKVDKIRTKNLWDRKIKPIFVGVIFSLIFFVAIFSLIVVDFSGMYAIISIFGLGAIFLGTMWNYNYIPNINNKYKILEKEEK